MKCSNLSGNGLIGFGHESAYRLSTIRKRPLIYELLKLWESEGLAWDFLSFKLKKLSAKV